MADDDDGTAGGGAHGGPSAGGDEDDRFAAAQEKAERFKEIAVRGLHSIHRNQERFNSSRSSTRSLEASPFAASATAAAAASAAAHNPTTDDKPRAVVRGFLNQVKRVLGGVDPKTSSLKAGNASIIMERHGAGGGRKAPPLPPERVASLSGGGSGSGSRTFSPTLDSRPSSRAGIPRSAASDAAASATGADISPHRARHLRPRDGSAATAGTGGSRTGADGSRIYEIDNDGDDDEEADRRRRRRARARDSSRPLVATDDADADYFAGDARDGGGGSGGDEKGEGVGDGRRARHYRGGSTGVRYEDDGQGSVREHRSHSTGSATAAPAAIDDVAGALLSRSHVEVPLRLASRRHIRGGGLDGSDTPPHPYGEGGGAGITTHGTFKRRHATSSASTSSATAATLRSLPLLQSPDGLPPASARSRSSRSERPRPADLPTALSSMTLLLRRRPRLHPGGASSGDTVHRQLSCSRLSLPRLLLPQQARR